MKRSREGRLSERGRGGLYRSLRKEDLGLSGKKKKRRTFTKRRDIEGARRSVDAGNDFFFVYVWIDVEGRKGH